MVVCIDPNSTIGCIDPKLHGQFIEFLGECIDEGLWVGEDSPIENEHGYRKATLVALRALQPPVIRWPGGCYADTYHWRDGVGPQSERKPPLMKTSPRTNSTITASEPTNSCVCAKCSARNRGSISTCFPVLWPK